MKALVVILWPLSIGVSAFFHVPALTRTSSGSSRGLARSLDMTSSKTDSDDEAFDCTYAALYPRQYVSYKLKDNSGLSPSTLDGDLTKSVWEEVPWTENFVDISTDTSPQFTTGAKIRWDDNFLYVGAQLQEPQVWGTLTEHDSVIFNDNDFEIFVDANATTHYYKEFEMNALNTTWDLCLNKPYGDSGYENSSRVFPDSGFDMQPPLQCAVRVDPKAALNNPATPGNFWSMEVALPLEALMLNSTAEKPTHGTMWRINFSRVEWGVTVNASTGQYEKAPSCQSCADPGSSEEDNWVWSPMQAVAMHNPERWGILQFSSLLSSGDSGDDGGKQEKDGDSETGTQPTTPLEYYDEWPARAAAAAVYWAQRSYAAANSEGAYAATYADLLPFSTPPYDLCPLADVAIELRPPVTEDDDEDNDGGGGGSWGYSATVQSPDGAAIAATITDDRFLTVSKT